MFWPSSAMIDGLTGEGAGMGEAGGHDDVGEAAVGEAAADEADRAGPAFVCHEKGHDLDEVVCRAYQEPPGSVIFAFRGPPMERSARDRSVTDAAATRDVEVDCPRCIAEKVDAALVTNVFTVRPTDCAAVRLRGRGG